MPLFDVDGRIVGVEKRAVVSGAEPKVRCLSGSVKTGSAFGLLGAGSAPVWIVEGFTDFLAASRISDALGVSALGIPGATFAASVVEARAALLRGRRVFVSTDSDPAGEFARIELRAALREVGAEPRIAPYPNGFGDLSEVPADRRARLMGEVFTVCLKEVAA